MRLRPSQPKTQAQIAFFGCRVLRSRILRHVESRNADSARRARYCHQLIEDRGGLLLAAALLGLESNAIDGTIHFGLLEYLADALTERASL